jgi:hypothetical protein
MSQSIGNSETILLCSYTTGSSNGASKYYWVCPYCMEHNCLETRPFEKNVYCENCWCWFEFDNISEIEDYKKYKQYIKSGVIKYASEEYVNKYSDILNEISSKFTIFGIEDIYEYTTIIYKNNDDNNN